MTVACTKSRTTRRVLDLLTLGTSLSQRIQCSLRSSADAEEQFPTSFPDSKNGILQAFLKKPRFQNCALGVQEISTSCAERRRTLFGAAQGTGDFAFPNSFLRVPSRLAPERPENVDSSPTIFQPSSASHSSRAVCTVLSCSWRTFLPQVRAGHPVLACTMCEFEQRQSPRRLARPIRQLQA